MKNKSFVLLFALLLLAGTSLIQIPKTIRIPFARQQQVADTVQHRVIESYGKLPLSFEANRGQVDGEVKFLSRGSEYNLFLTATEAVMEMRGRNVQDPSPRRSQRPQRNENSVIAASSVMNSQGAPVMMKMKLVGANAAARIEGADELPGKSNYFIGNDPSKWRTNVPTYAKVKYENVYPGIDLVYYGNQRQLEYDFVVAPGADPRTIRLAIGEEQQLRIDDEGNLVLGGEGSELRMHRPVVYQEISGATQRVAGGFVIRDALRREGGREVGFKLARYDASQPLIIDPALIFSTRFN